MAQLDVVVICFVLSCSHWINWTIGLIVTQTMAIYQRNEPIYSLSTNVTDVTLLRQTRIDSFLMLVIRIQHASKSPYVEGGGQSKKQE